MLILNSQQLKFLASVQQADDWHTSAFVDIVADYKKESTLTEIEFQDTIAELQKLSLLQIAHFQMVLNILNSLDWSASEGTKASNDSLKQMQNVWGLTFEKLNPHELALLLSHCLDLVYETIPHFQCDESVINFGRKMIQMSITENLELAEFLIKHLKEKYILGEAAARQKRCKE